MASTAAPPGLAGESACPTLRANVGRFRLSTCGNNDLCRLAF